MDSSGSSGQHASRRERLAWILAAAGWLLTFGLSPFQDLALLAYAAGGLSIYAIVLRSRRVHHRSPSESPWVRAVGFGAKLVIAVAVVAGLVRIVDELLQEIFF